MKIKLNFKGLKNISVIPLPQLGCYTNAFCIAFQCDIHVHQIAESIDLREVRHLFGQYCFQKKFLPGTHLEISRKAIQHPF